MTERWQRRDQRAANSRKKERVQKRQKEKQKATGKAIRRRLWMIYGEKKSNG